MTNITPKQIAKYLHKKRKMQCNCDLDKWEPEQNTGHNFICNIHKAAIIEPSTTLRKEVETYVKYVKQNDE